MHMLVKLGGKNYPKDPGDIEQEKVDRFKTSNEIFLSNEIRFVQDSTKIMLKVSLLNRTTLLIRLIISAI